MRVQLTAEARRNLARLPPKVFDLIAASVDGPITTDPRRSSKPLHNELASYRSVRRGDHRILLRIDDEVVTIVRIEHRSNVYRPR